MALLTAWTSCRSTIVSGATARARWHSYSFTMRCPVLTPGMLAPGAHLCREDGDASVRRHPLAALTRPEGFLSLAPGCEAVSSLAHSHLSWALTFHPFAVAIDCSS
eukprot:2927102-Rhodomonas_salina.3